MNIDRRTFLAALAGLAGCSAQQQQNTSSDGPPTIALVMKSLGNEFFLTMENGAKEHQQQNAAKYKLLANGIKNEQAVSKQIDLVEQMIAQRVDAIVIAPADSKALVAARKKAHDAGIVVVNIDNKLDATVLADNKLSVPFVGPDNRKGAKLAGDYLAKRLKPDDKVAIIEGIQTAFNAQQRKQGFEDAIAAANLKLVSSQSANWETPRATQVASAILIEQPELKALLCANDSMALGAVAAVREAGKAGQVQIVGFDNISAMKPLLKEGKVLATVDQHGDKLAVFGIEYALEILQKKSVPADRETQVDLITAEQVK